MVVGEKIKLLNGFTLYYVLSFAFHSLYIYTHVNVNTQQFFLNTCISLSVDTIYNNSVFVVCSFFFNFGGIAVLSKARLCPFPEPKRLMEVKECVFSCIM